MSTEPSGNRAQCTIGVYGPWAASLLPDGPGDFSYRHDDFDDLESWQARARQRLLDRIAQPDTGSVPDVSVQRRIEYDGLHIEELVWQLPYGPPTHALFLKPAKATGELPGIVALHDHGGNKYFGKRKITRTSDKQHPVAVEHQAELYAGLAWANEIAKRGYAVLVPDAFAFASRRVLAGDVLDPVRGELTDDDPENAENIAAYNNWAAEHESVLAKSLFSAGLTWPGVFLAEDQRGSGCALCAARCGFGTCRLWRSLWWRSAHCLPGRCRQ